MKFGVYQVVLASTGFDLVGQPVLDLVQIFDELKEARQLVEDTRSGSSTRVVQAIPDMVFPIVPAIYGMHE